MFEQETELMRWARIKTALATIDADVDTQSEDPVVFRSTDLSIGICTHSARMLQVLLGGKVMGYFHEDNPTALAGAPEGGHDFLVLDDYIVDWWLKDTYGTEDAELYRSTYHRVLDAELISKVYGDSTKWEEVPR